MKKTRIFLLAILSGLITTGIFYLYTLQAESASTTVDSEAIEKVDVVVANTDITIDQEITEEIISIKKVEKDKVHEKAITKLEDALGKFTTADITADEIVLEHRVRDKEDETKILSRKITDDKVAVSIDVSNYWETVTNLIVPEDYVDVIWTWTEENDDEEDILLTDILLEKKRVLAVGENIKENEPKGIDSPLYVTVTLELTHEEAIGVVHAQNLDGAFHLALHSKLNSEEEAK